MIVGDGWTYLHLPKSGGSFWMRYFETSGLGRRQERQHDGVRHTPTEQRDTRLVWGTIRHPLRWLESYYRHFYRSGVPVDGLTRFTDGTPAPISFRRWVYLSTHPLEAHDILKPIPIVPQHEGHTFATWAAEGGGFASWFYRYTFTVRGELRAHALVDATDDSRPGVVSLFRRHGLPLDHRMLWEWDGRTNGSPKSIACEWDQEMIGWVRSADGEHWRTYWPDSW